VGTLQPGKLADLVVLDGDPLAAGPGQLGSLAITQTWVGGVRRFSRT
jgi:predicted amidohydrolase YtcJ